VLEDYGHARFCSVRQRTGFPREQSLPALLWNRSQTLPVSKDRSCLHPYWRTMA
jgi:hypothetical protein